MVHGSFGECGDSSNPVIYIRLDDPQIFEFITEAVELRTTSPDWLLEWLAQGMSEKQLSQFVNVYFRSAFYSSML